jgi:hypothetical protein
MPVYIDLLPVVQPDTCFSVEQECLNIDDSQFVRKLYKKIKDKNPVVAMWIKNWAKKTIDPKGAAICALITYRLLESQEEADYLNELF